MKEVLGNIWDFHKDDAWIVIPTNGVVRKDGSAVMGRGLAKQASTRFPTIQYHLGGLIERGGNHVYTFVHLRLFTFPVKYNWMDDADLELIKRSVGELIFQVDEIKADKVYLPRVGCGSGRLSWADVKPLLKPLDDRFVIVSLEP